MRQTTFNIPANPIEAHKLVSGPVWRLVKAHAVAGNRMAIKVVEQSKSREAEQRYHAMISEIAKQVGGDLADADDAKRILISAFRIDTRVDLADEWAKFGEARMGRGLRNEVVLLGIQSRHFSRKLSTAFIEWLYAFGAEHSVKFAERVLDPETGELVYAKSRRPETC